MCANSEGSGETAWMRRLARVFAGRLCDKYHNLLSWLIYWSVGTVKFNTFIRNGVFAQSEARRLWEYRIYHCLSQTDSIKPSLLFSNLGLDGLSLAWPAVVQLVVSFNSGSQWIWLVVLRLNVPVNNFSVMSGRSHRFLGN